MTPAEVAPQFTRWGNEDYGWAANDPTTNGAPGAGLAGSAIQVWSAMQGREVTVTEAALAFCCTEEMIREAVQQHYWMFIAVNEAGQEVIDHEGD